MWVIDGGVNDNQLIASSANEKLVIRLFHRTSSPFCSNDSGCDTTTKAGFHHFRTSCMSYMKVYGRLECIATVFHTPLLLINVIVYKTLKGVASPEPSAPGNEERCRNEIP